MNPSRKRQRLYALLFLFASAALMIYLGFEGWVVNGLPAHYLGGLFSLVGILGMCGVNVWKESPLDLRLDNASPSPATEAELQAVEPTVPPSAAPHEPWWTNMATVRLGFLAATLVYLWFQTLFITTSHTVTEGRQSSPTIGRACSLYWAST